MRLKWTLKKNGELPGHPWKAEWPDGITHNASTWDAAAKFVWMQLKIHAQVQAELAGFGRRGTR